jgi:hypothetical protein
MRYGDLTTALSFMLIFFSILLGCAADQPKEVYRGYVATEQSESELATLDLGRADEVTIDDMYVISRGKYSTVKLLAGVHRIKWEWEFGFSVMVESSGFKAFGRFSNVNFEAGHTYKLSADRTHGQGYRVYFWIEDITSGKIVWGEKKP